MLFDAVLETNSKKEGYYDERGEWIEGPFPGGFYDASGAWRRGYYDEAGAFHPGYVDSNGEWVAAGDRPAGFYNEMGEWTPDRSPGVPWTRAESSGTGPTPSAARWWRVLGGKTAGGSAGSRRARRARVGRVRGIRRKSGATWTRER